MSLTPKEISELANMVTNGLKPYIEELVKQEVNVKVQYEALRIVNREVGDVIYKEIKSAVKRYVDVEVRLKPVISMKETGESGDVSL